MDEHPQRAIDSLAAINPKELSNADRHFYDFLSIKAKDKAYIYHTSDGLILDMIDYYSKGNDKAPYTEARNWKKLF